MSKRNSPLDFQKNEIRNVKAQNVAGAIGSLAGGDAGIFWFDSTRGRWVYWDGTQVVDPASSEETGWKPPADAAAIANVNIASPGATVGGVTMSAGMRVLLTAQTTATENGPWVWNGAASALTRPTDWDVTAEKLVGSSIFVKNGGANFVGIWVNTATNVWSNYSDLSVVLTQVGMFNNPNFGLHRLTNVSDPAGAQDAATKSYVDNVAAGLDAKASVRVATTGSETFTIAGGVVTQLASTTVDGIVCAIGDRILVKDAPTATGAGAVGSNNPGNGIYTVTSTAGALVLARATDMDAWTEIPSAYTWVEQGTTQADTGWVVTADAGGTLNTTGIQWSMFAASTTVSAGNGLIKSGNTLSVRGPGTGLVFDPGNSNQLTVGNSGGTAALGFIGVLGINNGGTGASSAAQARVNLGVVGKASIVNSSGAVAAGATFVATHGLNTDQLTVELQDLSGTHPVRFDADVEFTDLNNVTIGPVNPGFATGTLRVICIG